MAEADRSCRCARSSSAIAPKPAGKSHPAGHRRQPGIAEAEPGGARELAAVPANRRPGADHPSERGRKASRELARGIRGNRTRGRGRALHRGHAAALRSQADLVVSAPARAPWRNWRRPGSPAILVPFPFAADEHQLRNAEAFARAGAARLVLDGEDSTGDRSVREVLALAAEARLLARMGGRRATLAKPGAAKRAAEILEELRDRREIPH